MHGPNKNAAGQQLFPWQEEPVKPAAAEASFAPAARERESLNGKFNSLVSQGMGDLSKRLQECLDVLLNEIPAEAQIDQHGGSMHRELVRLFGFSDGGQLQIPDSAKLRYFYRAIVREKLADKSEGEHWGNAISYMAEVRRICPLIRSLKAGLCEDFVAEVIPPMRRASAVSVEAIALGVLDKFAERLYRNNRQLREFVQNLFEFAGVEFAIEDKKLVAKFKAALQEKRLLMASEALSDLPRKPQADGMLFPPEALRDPLAAFKR